MQPSWTTILLQHICAELGYRIDCYDPRASMCRIIFPEGTSTLFHSSTLNINGAASRVASVDKAYTKFFLEQSGITVPQGTVAFSREWCDVYELEETANQAVAYVKEHNIMPVFVKPNRGYQGRLVYKVHNHHDLSRAINIVLQQAQSAVIEECVVGEEYRLLWYRGTLWAAYHKTPLRVIGDGESAIGILLEDKRSEHMLRGRGDVIISQMDTITERLHQLGYTLDTILPIGIEVRLRDNANLSTGGDLVDVTEVAHPDFAKLSDRIAKAMDLNLVGIDIISTTPITEPIGEYWVLEVAHTPGLRHFSSLGEEQYRRVKAMYTDIIERLRQNHAS